MFFKQRTLLLHFALGPEDYIAGPLQAKRSYFLSNYQQNQNYVYKDGKKANYYLLCVVIREGNGTPLQYSCLENPMDGGAW